MPCLRFVFFCEEYRASICWIHLGPVSEGRLFIRLSLDTFNFEFSMVLSVFFVPLRALIYSPVSSAVMD